jgi:predicted nucleic acid-binding protein
VKVFLDTSAFAKRYISEQKSGQVMALCEGADNLIVSVLCLPELLSTLCRLVREKKLSKVDYRKLKGEALADLADVDVCQLTSGVLDSAMPLLEAYPLRCGDALQLGCAVATRPDVFVSADRRQLAAARKTGLSIVDVSCT